MIAMNDFNNFIVNKDKAVNQVWNIMIYNKAKVTKLLFYNSRDSWYTTVNYQGFHRAAIDPDQLLV